MPAKSQAQRGLLNARFGHAWVKRHNFDNKGKLPKHKAQEALALRIVDALLEGMNRRSFISTLGKIGGALALSNPVGLAAKATVSTPVDDGWAEYADGLRKFFNTRPHMLSAAQSQYKTPDDLFRAVEPTLKANWQGGKWKEAAEERRRREKERKAEKQSSPDQHKRPEDNSVQRSRFDYAGGSEDTDYSLYAEALAAISRV